MHRLHVTRERESQRERDRERERESERDPTEGVQSGREGRRDLVRAPTKGGTAHSGVICRY